MSACDSQKPEASKDNVSTNSIDEGLPRELSQLSLSSGSNSDEFHCNKGHSEATMKNIYGYYQSQKLCDVALIASGCRIPAHKVVLASCSEYFAAMFTGSLREAQSSEITLERVDSQALRSLVHYCYTGIIELSEDTVEILLSTASLLQLHSVTKACCDFLEKQLDPCNCLGIALFAEQQSCMSLHKSALEYTYQHFMQVIKHQEFLTLQVDQLASLLKCDDLNVATEENVFESLMAWIQHDNENREQHLSTLLKLIKLPLLSSEYLIDKVEQACGEITECQPLIMEAVKWHLLPERRSLLFSHRTRPRKSTIGRLLAIGGMDGYKGASNMEMYDPRTNTWTPFMKMGARRLQFGVAVMQNKLIVVGGRDGLKTLNTVECFDLTSLSWSTLAPMNTHRHGLGVAVLGDGPNAPIYAVGGHDGWIYLNSVERWDACSRTWTMVSAMAGARSTCGVAALRGRLYAVGGRDGGACLRSVECYDPATNHWTNCAPMTRRRGGVSDGAITEEYQNAYRRSLENPEEFWAEVAQECEWTRPWDKVLDDSNPPFTKWWVGGELSVCYNAVDRHVPTRGDQVALVHDSPLTDTVKRITYSELQDQVSRLAGQLSSLGVTRGSRVLIYMPLIPEVVVAMLATNRLGAIHSVVFGGFAARELRTRIEHAEPTVIIAASCGVEPNKIVRYKDILDEALCQSSHIPRKCIIYQRRRVLECALVKGRDMSWEEAIEAEPAPCVSTEANEALYILYTSGTTDDPKGIQRPCGHAAVLCWSMRAVYGLQRGVWWAASDLGWVVGHSYICYGPLLAGLTTVLYEGKPDRTPDPGQYFRIIEQHRVNALFTIPTACRVLKRTDPNGKYARRYCGKSLKTIFIAGEHCDQETRHWAESIFGVPVLNHWWQTETGSPITAACLGYGMKGIRPHSTGYPVPGYNLRALREDGTECHSGEVGRLVAKLPLPPGFASTLWLSDERFKKVYFDTYPGYYDTQDVGWISAESSVWVVARADDVINVAGHRLSTAAIEDVVLKHARVADAVVVGAPDPTKGDVPLCLYVMRPPQDDEEMVAESTVTQELIALVRHLIGPIAAFRKAVAVPALPRTRSGKALRGAISKLARSQRVKLPATIEDPSVFGEIKIALQKFGYAIEAPDPEI